VREEPRRCTGGRGEQHEGGGEAREHGSEITTMRCRGERPERLLARVMSALGRAITPRYAGPRTRGLRLDLHPVGVDVVGQRRRPARRAAAPALRVRRVSRP
jgi:hypothetical protein